MNYTRFKREYFIGKKATMSIRLPIDMIAEVKRISRKTGLKKSDVVRVLITQGLNK